jgi:hypothetical protein
MSNFGEAVCANPECENTFTKKASNAVYCRPECRTKVMNKRILERYHSKKKRLKNKEPRVCNIKNCTVILSKYNKENICESHKTERLIKRLSRWGWDEAKLRDEWSE